MVAISRGWRQVKSIASNISVHLLYPAVSKRSDAFGSSGPINQSAKWPGNWGFNESRARSRQLHPSSLNEAQRADLHSPI